MTTDEILRLDALAAKTAIARELFNYRTEGTSSQAPSPPLEPDSTFHSKVVAAMKSRGYDQKIAAGEGSGESETWFSKPGSLLETPGAPFTQDANSTWAATYRAALLALAAEKK